MYAVIQTGGKQYRVQEGDVITVEKLEKEGNITFTEVLLVSDGTTSTIGTPFVENAVVEAEITANGKSEKVIIYKYKAKKDYRRKQGHRQPFTQLKIVRISAP